MSESHQGRRKPGLDAWGATVCCGTNFVARATALHQVDYFPTESITEDYLLSLKLAAAGLDVRYHSATLSTGEAPEATHRLSARVLASEFEADHEARLARLTSRSSNQDTKIFSLALLLSSFFV